MNHMIHLQCQRSTEDMTYPTEKQLMLSVFDEKVKDPFYVSSGGGS